MIRLQRSQWKDRSRRPWSQSCAPKVFHCVTSLFRPGEEKLLWNAENEDEGIKEAASSLAIQHQGSSGRISHHALAGLPPAAPSNGRWQEDRLSTNGAKCSPRSHRQLGLGVGARPSQYVRLIFVTHGSPGSAKSPGQPAAVGRNISGSGPAARQWSGSLAISWFSLCPAPAGSSPALGNSKRAAVIKRLLV